MPQQASRYQAASPVSPAEGWSVERLTQPSRLFGANGLRTGKDGRLYVAQVAGSQVSAIDVNSGAIEAYSPMGGAITGPDDLAFDDDGNLYCTEITENKVRVLRPDGSSDVIADLRVANPITYHQGHLIAGELMMGGRIVELDRNGGAPRVILDNVPMANAFEVGPDGKLYFPAQGANEIWRVSLEGGEPEVVARDLGVPDSVKFHPDGYIVSTQVYSGQVLKIDPRTGEKSVLADIGPGLDNVAFIDGRTFVSHITGSIHEIVAPGQAKPLVDKGLQWPLGLAVGSDGALFVADGGFTYLLRSGGGLELIGMLFSAGFPGWVRAVAPAAAANGS
jgi:sugar lactone lactonase YvrE